ncbi:MAG: hypothetical protein ACYTEQ_09410 [Planctomycetota bacterium]|jgi:hypothetical protein
MICNRKQLVSQAVDWLVDWNYKAFRQEIGDPHSDDFLSETAKEFSRRATGKEPLPYVIRNRADAHNAIENIISLWRHGYDSDTPEVDKMTKYYRNLSEIGHNRLFNEVDRLASKRLARKIERYQIKKCLLDKEKAKYLTCSVNHRTDLVHPFNRHKKPGDRCNMLLSYDVMAGPRYCRRILR